MRPYGWKRLEWRDEDHAPCTKYVGHGIRSPQRRQRRRKLHQRARRMAVSDIHWQVSEMESDCRVRDLDEWTGDEPEILHGEERDRVILELLRRHAGLC